MEVVKTIKLPCKASVLDSFLRSTCEDSGVWPTADVTSDGQALFVTYRTRDIPDHAKNSIGG